MSYDLYDPCVQEDKPPRPPLPSKDHLTPQRPIALDSSGHGGVNVSLHAPQTVRLPLMRNLGTEGILRIDSDIPHSTWSKRETRKDDKRLSEYRWNAASTDDAENYSSSRRLHPSSVEAQCVIEMQSPSPNYFDTTPPSTSSTLGRFPKPPAQHPFAKNFEVPQWRNLFIHTGLCALSYPFLLFFVIIGRGKSLFWSRLFVGAGSGILGVTLGLSLMRMARGVLEAATWATVIHQSRIPDSDPNGAGVRLKDLVAHSDDPTSSWAALRLLWDRHSYPGADRKYRKFYDARRWSIWIIFFLLNVIFSGAMTFILGRVVDINIQVVHQQWNYQEVVVSGDLSQENLNRADALLDIFENLLLTWPLAPLSSNGVLPSVLSLGWNNESVFFSEVILSQLIPGGSGFGTFDITATAPSLNISSQDLIAAAPTVGAETGSVLRFPRWGIRIKCAKIPDLPLNLLVSKNNITYLFTPQSTIRPLFDYFDMPFPQDFQQPFNFSTVLSPNDALPSLSDIDASRISLGAKFWDNGVAYSIKSFPLSLGQDGNGFIAMENILVRLDTTLAPNGTFGTKGILGPDIYGNPTNIGYDAAICLELYEPWVVEVYNSSVGFPSSMRIVDKAAEIMDMNTEKMKEKRLGKPVSDPLVKRQLNSTNMTTAYIIGHQNSVNQIIKESDSRDSYYVPSPTLISFTGASNVGPLGYTELSEVYYAESRALADAGNILPYFAGSGLVVARSYQDQIVTSPVISNIPMCMTILAVFLMGLISALFIPRLPLDVPRRGFNLYSWFSAFYERELVAEHPAGISKDMDLKEIMDHTSELKFRYVGWHWG